MISFIVVDKDSGEEHSFSSFNKETVVEQKEKANAKLLSLVDSGVTAYQFREGAVSC